MLCRLDVCVKDAPVIFYQVANVLSRTSSDSIGLPALVHFKVTRAADSRATSLRALKMSISATTPLILLRAAQVCSKLKISRTTLYAKLDKNSKYFDPDFPKQIQLGPSSVGWVEQQIDQWILRKISSV